MIVLNFDEYNLHKKAILRDLSQSVFIYPTDTIYGIGCDATNDILVKKVRAIKKTQYPFSIIVPNKEWIYKNCVVSEEAEEWIRKLPGPYTLIMRLKNPKAISKEVNGGTDTIGIRMPNHWFLTAAFKMGVPIVTTSANVSGNDFMTSLDDLDVDIRNKVHYIFYDGPTKIGYPSTLVHLEGEHVEIQQRKEKSSRKEKINFPLEEIKLVK